MIKKKNYKYSIIIPTYNRKVLLKIALNSAIAQNNKEFEIIIIDNYSSDNTEELVKRLMNTNKNIKYFKYNNNGIIGAARNFGAKKAEGEYLCFLDSDDKWFKNKLEQVDKVISKKEVEFLYHDLKLTSVNLKSFFRRKIKGKKYQSSFYLEPLINGNKINTSSVVISKDLFLSEGGFEIKREFVCCECVDLWINILKRTNKVVYLNKTLGEYLLHNDNISNSRFYIPFINVCAKYSKLLSNNQRKTLYSRRIYIGSLFKLKKFFIYALKNGNLEIKIKLIIKYILTLRLNFV